MSRMTDRAWKTVTPIDGHGVTAAAIIAAVPALSPSIRGAGRR